MRTLQVLVAAVVLCGVSASSVLAQAPSDVPRAGSSIGNQASATYTDGSGSTRTTTSNPVQTTVTQVAGVDLAQDQSARGATGQPVNFSHEITNTGNGTDTFALAATEASPNITGPGGAATLLIYPDLNRDGRPDPGAAPITSTPALQPGQSFAFVVSGEVPGNVSTGTATVTVTATSGFNSQVTDTNTDTLTVTNNAVVNVVKSISSSSGAPGASGFNYTLTYTNTGNTPSGPLTITDDIPTGLLYRTGSGFWSVGSLSLTDAPGDVQGAAPDTIDYSTTDLGGGRTRLTIVISRVETNANFFVRFGFDVPTTSSPGSRSNTASFNYDDDANPATAPVAANTNTVPFNVTATGGVTGSGDTFGPAGQSTSFDFLNTFTNSGTGADTFDITVAQPGTFPAGTSFLLLRAPAGTTRPVGTALIAGAAPLVDSNGNGTPDTGQLAVGASVVVVVRVQLPPGASGNNGGAGFTVSKTATSPSTGSTITVTDTLTAITAATLDIRNTQPNSDTPSGAENGGTGAGTNTVINSYPATPNTTTRIPLSVTNTSAQPDNFNLQFSTTNNFAAPTGLPAGYTLRFVDVNGAVITNTGNVAPGQTVRFFAEVVPPAGATPATIDLFFRAVSATGGVGGASDFLRDQIVVGTRRAIAVEPNNSGQTFQGSSVTYSHTITNNGNVDEAITLTSANTAAGFSTSNYVDLNNNGVIDATDTLIPSGGTVNVPAGGTVNILTRVFAPSQATPGTVNTTTLSASGTGTIAGVAAPTDTASDTTTIVAGQLQLVKEQALDAAGDGTADTAFTASNVSAAPGQSIRYRITVSNIGTQPVSNIVITDATPGFTTYSAAGPATLTAPGGVTSPATVAPAGGGTGALRFEFATPLLPGQSVVATFGVRING